MAALSFVPNRNIGLIDASNLIYVHCVSQDEFEVVPVNMDCVILRCREVHVSFLDKMDTRRVALFLTQCENRRIDDAFEGTRSPALVQVEASCNFTVRDIWAYLTKSLCEIFEVTPSIS